MKTSALAKSLIAAVSLVIIPALLLQAKADPLYIQTNLVSDLPNVAAITDPNLVNLWAFPIARPARYGCQIRQEISPRFMQ